MPSKKISKPRNIKKVPLRESKLRKTKGTAVILSPETAQKIVNEWQCFEMRRDGYSYMEISRALEITPGIVRRHLEAAYSRTLNELQETVEEARQLEIERLDALVVTYSKLAHGYKEVVDVPVMNAAGNPIKDNDGNIITMPKEVQHAPNMGAASILLSVQARRAKLLALDAPEVKKIEHSGIREYVGVDISQV